ncbi:hypothetical protein ACL02R_14195 [Streptomyces sp. MS19]|uniref:hypothetical protein n=1 Tax=Streptomyces sp. MS19 TaxID=3385972 RepID=UPI0039A1FE22
MTHGTNAGLSAHDRRMTRLMNQDAARHWHARRWQRRTWTAAHIALTAGAFALFALAGDSGALLLAVLVPLLLAWCVCTGVLNTATRGLFELRARALDERQLADRARAHTVAHRVQFAVLLAVLAVLLITDGLPDGMTAAGVVAALAVTHWLLPLWVAVLRTEDETDDDELPATTA